MAVGVLAGRTFLVAASEDRTEPLAAALRHLGATAIPYPTVRLVPPQDLAPLDSALRAWSSFDWVVFTSTHGVDAVVNRATTLRIDLRRFRGRIAAVGPATKARLVEVGLPVHAVPTRFLTDEIADVLGDIHGERILLPRSRIARKSLAEALRSRGAEVEDVDAYDAVPASPDSGAIRNARRIDFVVFTSASTATNLAALLPMEALHRIQSGAQAVCIGPVTADAAMSLGFRVSVIAEEHSIPGLVRALTGVAVHG